MSFIILNFYESPENYHLEKALVCYFNKKKYDSLVIHNFNYDYGKFLGKCGKNRFHFKNFDLKKIKDHLMLISIDFPWIRDKSYLFYLSLLKKIKSKKIIIANHLCPDPGQSCFIDDAKKYGFISFFSSVYILEYDDFKLWPKGAIIKKRSFAIDTDYYKPLLKPKKFDILCFGTKSREIEWVYSLKDSFSIAILTSKKNTKNEKVFFEIEKNLFNMRDLINQSYLTAIPIRENEKNEACGNTGVFLSLACGVPVLVRETNYMKRFIVEGNNGFLYKDKNEFSKKLSNILKDKRKLIKMREKAREAALKFASLNNIVETIISKEVKI